MANPKITYFKVYDTTNGWQIYYPRTTVAAIGVNSERKFLSAQVRVNGYSANTYGAKVTVDSTGDGANIMVNALHIPANASASSHYMGQLDTVAAALQALDTACYNAYNHVPTNCLTYGNDGNFDDQFPDLYAIEELSGTSGFLKKTGANQWTLDTNAYVPDTRTVNGKRLNANINLGAGDIDYSNNKIPLATTVDLALSTIYNIAQGKQSPYAISDAATGTGVINTQLNSQSDVSINATFTVGSTGVTSDKKLKLSNNTIIDVATLKVGDNVFITEPNVPDRWVSAITYPSGGGVGSITFSILETQKVDLTWNSITGKPTTIGGYGITDAKITKSGDSAVITLGTQTLDAYISNGVIHLNGQTIQPLTSHQSLASLVPYTGATSDVNLGTHSLSLKNITASGSISANSMSVASGIEFGASSEISYDSNDNLNVSVLAGNFQIEAENMTLNSKNVATISAGTTQPSSPRVGDIWIDTTTPS